MASSLVGLLVWLVVFSSALVTLQPAEVVAAVVEVEGLEEGLAG